jgi:hypothetical protein
MAKEKSEKGPINRHKELAMGKEIKVMKKGGACMKDGGAVKKPHHPKKHKK